MITASTAPGVRFEWADGEASAIGAVRTDVAGFVGIAERGPLHRPLRVESWTQLRSLFGGHVVQGFLAYAVEGFFANGGRACWVVRIADPETAKPARLDLGSALRLEASSPGVWGQRLSVRLARLGRERFSLTLALPGGERELWANLTLDDAERRLNDPARGSALVRAVRLSDRLEGLSDGIYSLAGGADGLAALTPEHFDGPRVAADGESWGLRTLEPIDEIGLVAMPDLMIDPRRASPPPARERCHVPAPAPEVPEPEGQLPSPFSREQILELQKALVAHGRKHYRMALLDPPGRLRPDEISEWRLEFDTSHAALYYPWLRVSDPLRSRGNTLLDMPASGHLAGIYARTELEAGVHKPPANQVLEGARDVVTRVAEPLHGVLNDRDINVLRPFTGRGLRVYGARTLASDSTLAYVNVRRLLNLILRGLEASLQWTVFEPDNPDLWRTVARIARAFIDRLWRQGALDGKTPEEAYFVRCDATTNPPEDIAAGRLVCQIGIRPVWPAEIVVARIGRTEGHLEILDVGGGSRG